MDSKGVAHVLLWMFFASQQLINAEAKNPQNTETLHSEPSEAENCNRTWGVWAALLRADAVPSAEDISTEPRQKLAPQN